MRTPFLPRRAGVAAILIAAMLLAPGGCGSGSALRIVSSTRQEYLQPEWRTSVFRNPDRETCEVFLSDLPPEELLAALEGRRLSATGNVLAFNVFIRPAAGRTPIDATACNATITHLVLAGSGVGYYGGGGFIFPSTDHGDAEFAAKLSLATLRFIRAQGGFTDRLEASEISGAIRAVRDEALAGEISARLAMMPVRMPG